MGQTVSRTDSAERCFLEEPANASDYGWRIDSASHADKEALENKAADMLGVKAARQLSPVLGTQFRTWFVAEFAKCKAVVGFSYLSTFIHMSSSNTPRHLAQCSSR